MMQRNVAYINRGEYLDTNVDEDEYGYIDIDVVPQDDPHYDRLQSNRHQYEELRRNPEPSVPESRMRELPPVVSVDAYGRGDTCCRRPPCWAWALIVLSIFIAATLVALLFFFLTSTTSTSTVSDSSVMTTVTTSMNSVPNTDDITTTTGHCNIKTTMPSTQATTKMNQPIYRDCYAAYNNGKTNSGVYRISPDGVTEIDVYCEQEIDGGGWTVFQHRINGSVNFNLEWASYKKGFGNIYDEYWLGNDVIHLMTVNQDQKLKVELKTGTYTGYADYSEFWIKSESRKYQLHVAGFSERGPVQSNAGDSLTQQNGMYFSTPDEDNDLNCAAVRNSAWWYYNITLCGPSDLNAPYSPDPRFWDTMPLTPSYTMVYIETRMMIKTK